MKLQFANLTDAMQCWDAVESGGIVIEGPKHLKLSVPSLFTSPVIVVADNNIVYEGTSMHRSLPSPLPR
jgi:hypothetical protein